MNFFPTKNLRIKTYHEKNMPPIMLQKIQLLTDSPTSILIAFVISFAVKTDINITTKNSIACQIQKGNDSLGMWILL